MATINNFTKLIAWQKSHALVLKTYELTKSFPKEEIFGLISQMRRASVSASSNIAEGFGRSTLKDKIHFYSMAKGSVFELQNQFIICKDLNYISLHDWEVIDVMCVEIQKIISGLQKSAMNL